MLCTSTSHVSRCAASSKDSISYRAFRVCRLRDDSQAGARIGILVTMVITKSSVLICIDGWLAGSPFHVVRYRPSVTITISRLGSCLNLTDCWPEDVPQLATMCGCSKMQLGIAHEFRTMHFHHPVPASTLIANFEAGMVLFRHSRYITVCTHLLPSRYPLVAYQ